jgi:hypothetical protein
LLSNADTFLSDDGCHRGLFIDGKEQPAENREIFPVVSPATGNVIARTVNADLAVASARRAFESAPWRKMSERSWAKLVYSLGDTLEKHLDELYELETLNNGDAQGRWFWNRRSSADQSFLINCSAANWASASDAKSSGVTTLRTVSPPTLAIRAFGTMAARQCPGLRRYVTIENSETFAMIASEDRLSPATFDVNGLLHR